MKDLVWWAWLVGLGLIIGGLITHIVLDTLADGTGETPRPTGCWITTLGGVLVLLLLFCPASYQPL